jgi:hypothetical protein
MVVEKLKIMVVDKKKKTTTETVEAYGISS